MSPEWAKYKRDERSRRKDSGLVKKEVWIPPQAWEALRDLADREAEVFLRDKKAVSFLQGNDAFAHEVASEFWSEAAILCAQHSGGATSQDGRWLFIIDLMRALIRTMPKDLDTESPAFRSAMARWAEEWGDVTLGQSSVGKVMED